MREKVILITNNELTYNSMNSKHEAILIDGSLMDVLTIVRDYIHKGHRLLTHPLMGSIKPNETPYKSVAISYKNEGSVDIDSLMYIEKSIETASRMLINRPLRQWKESVLEDFRVIDYDLINNAINS